MDGLQYQDSSTGIAPYELQGLASQARGGLPSPPPSMDAKEAAMPLHSDVGGKTFLCWVEKVGGVGMIHSNVEADRGLCTNCFPKLKATCNQFRVPRERTVIMPIGSRFEKEPNQKDFWYSYVNGGQTLVAREVSVGKNSPLRVYFVREPYAKQPRGPADPRIPDNDMWFSYKFGIHDFALYRWKGRGFTVDTKISKTPNQPEAIKEIADRAADPSSGVILVSTNDDHIYFQDLHRVVSGKLSSKASRKRKSASGATSLTRVAQHPRMAIPPAIGADGKRPPSSFRASGQPNASLNFSRELFSAARGSPTFSQPILNAHDPAFKAYSPAGAGAAVDTSFFFARPLRSNTARRDDLKGVRTIEGVKLVNNFLEGKFFRRGDNTHTVLESNLAHFYTEKFCQPYDFFSIISDYKGENISIRRYSGETCTPLSLQLQKDLGITICATFHHKYWQMIQNRPNRDPEKAINLFVDAHNTRIRDGDLLVCKVAKHGNTPDNLVITRKSTQCFLTLVKRRPETDEHQLLRHLVLRLLACLQMVQVPRQYHGKRLRDLGLQNDGLTVWSVKAKSGSFRAAGINIHADTRLEQGMFMVVKKSRKDADLEEKCKLFSRGELGWLDDEEDDEATRTADSFLAK